jgi:ABC-type sulfate transport system substrate-binding protein
VREVIARNYCRPGNPGGWNKAQAKYFNDGGLFDQVFVDARK